MYILQRFFNILLLIIMATRKHLVKNLSLHSPVSKFLAGSLHRAFNGVKPECFQLLEVLCINESNELEPNLARDCTVTLAYFAFTILSREVIGDFLGAVEGIVARSASWKAKTAALDLLQVSDAGG